MIDIKQNIEIGGKHSELWMDVSIDSSECLSPKSVIQLLPISFALFTQT